MSTFFVSLLTVVTIPAYATGVPYALDPNHSQVRFNWNHLGFSNPGADFDTLKGTLIWNAANPDQSSVTVHIPVASVHTQVPLLDKRLISSEFFDAAKYPLIIFKSTRVERINKSNKFKITGDLTVHGITKSVVLDATLNKAGQQPLLKAPAVGFNAVTIIKRSDFGLNAYVPLVSDDVHIHITVEAVEPRALAKEMVEFAAKAKSGGK
jgi:polyisoprenoid-binding protein YceI